MATAVALAAQAQASPGDLDRTFSGDGRIFGGFSATAVQSDGSTVTATVAASGTPGQSEVSLRRVDPSGDDDPSFDTEFLTGDEVPLRSLTIDSADQIIVLAQSAVLRFESDGAPDPTFGDDGRVDFGSDVQPRYATVDSHDRIVLVAANSVRRFLDDGSPDPTFSGDGVAPVFEDPGLDGYRVVTRPDDSMIAVGDIYASDPRYPQARYYLALLGEDGSPVPGFGDNGLLDLGWTYPAADEDVAPGPAGTFYSTANGLRRFEPDGSVDPTFDFEGLENLGYPTDLLVDDHGRLLILATGRPDTGRSDYGYSRTASVYRVLPDGSLDRSFGDGGAAYVYGHGGGILGGDELELGPGGTLSGSGRGSLWRLSSSSGAADRDGDGRADKMDRCPWLPGPDRRSGCPSMRPDLGDLHVGGPDPTYFQGQIAAPQKACSSGVVVDLYRRHRGTTRLYGTDRSNRPSVYRIEAPLRPGRYVAKVKYRDEGEHGICRPAESDAFVMP